MSVPHRAKCQRYWAFDAVIANYEGSTLATLESARAWCDVVFDGTNWIILASGTNGVTSINGGAGAVTLDSPAVVADIPNYATGGAVVLNYPVQEARLR
jgi:hypothetical protein